MDARRPLLLVLIWITSATLSYGTYIEIKAGKNFLPIRLKAGWIDIAFGFNTHPVEPAEVDSNSVTIIINDPQGNTLFRASPLTAMGWQHDRFYNPEEQLLRVWAKGGFAITPAQGGGIARALDENGTLVGGDAIASGPDNPDDNPKPPSSPQTPPQPKVRVPEIHAVIISGHTDPTKILLGNVHLVGGLIALGKQPENPGTWDPGLKITPDPELITGAKVPPVTPNLFDVRITHYDISAELENPDANP